MRCREDMNELKVAVRVGQAVDVVSPEHSSRNFEVWFGIVLVLYIYNYIYIIYIRIISYNYIYTYIYVLDCFALFFDQGHRHGRQAEANHWLPDQNNAGAAQFPGCDFMIFYDCSGHFLRVLQILHMLESIV